MTNFPDTSLGKILHITLTKKAMFEIQIGSSLIPSKRIEPII